MTDSLPGGRFSGPTKEGQTVVRKGSGPNTTALLRHLERSGFDLAPRYISTTNGQDTLSYLPGTAGLTPFTDDVRSGPTGEPGRSHGVADPSQQPCLRRHAR